MSVGITGTLEQRWAQLHGALCHLFRPAGSMQLRAAL
jgi:hypothetical protein